LSDRGARVVAGDWPAASDFASFDFAAFDFHSLDSRFTPHVKLASEAPAATRANPYGLWLTTW
jgi:hypothetical protein